MNRATEDAIALFLQTALNHLEGPNTYVRLLFMDYSSAFNTVIPCKLTKKLHQLGLSPLLCNWIQDFLTDCSQAVRLSPYTSSSITLSTGTPQGCVLSAILYSLFSQDCVPTFDTNTIVKLADDTTIVGLITNNDESAIEQRCRNWRIGVWRIIYC